MSVAVVQSLWEPGWIVSGWERLGNVQVCAESIGLLMALKGRDSRGKQSKMPHFNMCQLKNMNWAPLWGCYGSQHM